MSKSMKKQAMIDELSERAFTTRKQTEAILESLIEIIGREAVNGFAIPGLCKFEIAERKPRKGRNPQTGESIQIPATKKLRIKPFGRVKHAATSWLDSELQRSETQNKQEKQGDKSFFISCPHCGRKLEADASMSGLEAECPFCMNTMTVPNYEDYNKGEDTPTTGESGDYILFYCSMCSQTIETPPDQAGTRMSCPVCNANVEVPSSTELNPGEGAESSNKDIFGSTIRIDLG